MDVKNGDNFILFVTYEATIANYEFVKRKKRSVEYLLNIITATLFTENYIMTLPIVVAKLFVIARVRVKIITDTKLRK